MRQDTRMPAESQGIRRRERIACLESAPGAASRSAALEPLLRRAADDRAPRPRGPAARRARPRRPLGLRQVDPARADRRPARAERGRDRGRRRRRAGGAARRAAPTCPSATCCSPGSRRSTTPRWRCATAACAAAEARRRGRARSSSASAWPASRRARPAELSGGMRQRVAFLRTLIAGKPVLRSTSPSPRSTRSPGPRCRSGWRRRCAADPRTVVLVTHDVEEALYLCDRVAVLSARPARIVAELSAPAPRAADRDAAVTDPALRRRSRERALRGAARRAAR